MLTLPPSVKVYVATAPVDMRKQIDGLAALCSSALELDPLCGHLIVFFSRRGDYSRILFWDRNGYCLFSKRLEKGRFTLPWEGPQSCARHEIEAAELALILEGIDLRGSRRRPRWNPPRQTELVNNSQ